MHLQSSDDFNLCPVDYCQVPEAPASGVVTGAISEKRQLVEGYRPSSEVIESVKQITLEANIEVGGVEYLINDRDWQIYYYDINALSNFVADAMNVVGFDPFPKLVDFILFRSGHTVTQLAIHAF